MNTNQAHNKYATFAGQRHELARLLGESSDVISDLNMLQFQKNLKALQEKVHNDTFKIMVVGTFKNGKSTFINSFLGEYILPAYSIPCTAVINEVKYGAQKKAVLHFRNPLPEKLPAQLAPRALAHMKKHQLRNVPPLEIPYDEIEDYVVIPMGTDASEMLLESPYEKVELYWPLDLLKNGVEIIDSPGLNEHATRTKVTMEYLSKADAIVMVLNAQALCSEKEMEFIAGDLKGQGFDDPFFVINRFDCIPAREQDMVKRFATAKLKEYTSFGAEGLYFVSALAALEGKEENNAEKFESSGMAIFERKLSEFLTQNKGKVKLAQPARELKRILNEEALFKVIPMQRKSLSSDLDEVKARYAKLRPQLGELSARKQQLHNRLLLRIEQSKYEFRRVANRSVLELTDNIPLWIDEYEPKNSIGLIPNKAKSEAVVKEIMEHVTEKMTQHQRDWRTEVLTPLVQEKSTSIFETAEKDVSDILQVVDELSVDISGREYTPSTVPVWQRVAGVVGGLMLNDVGLAMSGGINGLSKELAKTAAFEAGAGIALYFLGILNPFTICLTIVGAFLMNWINSETRAVKKLKESIKADVLQQLSGNADESSNDIAENITGKLTTLATQITGALDTEISELNEQVKGIIAEMEKGKDNIALRENVINTCENKIKELSTGLDELIFQLVKG